MTELLSSKPSLASRLLTCSLSQYNAATHSTPLTAHRPSCSLHRSSISRHVSHAGLCSSRLQSRIRQCATFSYNPNPKGKKKTEYGYIVVDPDDPDPVPNNDPFTGEQWEILGKLIFFATPVLFAGVVFVGIYAAASYNNGADTYLATPTSDQDSAKLVKADKSAPSISGSE